MIRPLPRRHFVAASAALALPGCAITAPRVASTPPICLPRVKVSADRVIRTVAGLRPYRAKGFVVRAEALGDKRLVHNYGHGGAGITLSWGTSRLAADLGLPGHSGAVAVIGSGVMGLSTARLVQEAGFPVTIYTAALPPDTTSNIAGGEWSPYGHFERDAVTPEWHAQFSAAQDYSWRRFQIMVGDDYGVRWLPVYAEGAPRRPSPYRPGEQALAAPDHSFPVDRINRFETMFIETGRYLRQLLRDVQVAGGAVKIRKFADRSELAALPETLVFNCTGLGSRAMLGDLDLRPVRGQLAVLAPQPEIGYAFTGGAGYMFPRPDGIILGGTFEIDQWSTEPVEADVARILASHRALFGGFRCAA
ncbi:MAG: FAD-dependent oxidoreductase [Sphingopyxis sp.]|uniref:FAD-dependent oxidoreductase n=1 Tax=Sphingopyxis sp. TaxID=1908224 RepID=UPI0032F08CF7